MSGQVPTSGSGQAMTSGSGAFSGSGQAMASGSDFTSGSDLTSGSDFTSGSGQALTSGSASASGFITGQVQSVTSGEDYAVEPRHTPGARTHNPGSLDQFREASPQLMSSQTSGTQGFHRSAASNQLSGYRVADAQPVVAPSAPVFGQHMMQSFLQAMLGQCPTMAPIPTPAVSSDPDLVSSQVADRPVTSQPRALSSVSSLREVALSEGGCA